MSGFDYLTIEGTRARRPEPSTESGVHPLSNLQSSLGNAGIARMLQREGAPEEEEELQAKHDPSRAVQREGAPEEEEELQAKHDPSRAVQREGAPEEEEELQAKHDGLAQREPEVGMAGGPVSAGLSERINTARGGGSPLDPETKGTMEETLGASLDGVKVHVGNESDQLNHAITAKAFTTGSDVFVRSDQWAPGSSSTQRLLAHELTHVVQQRTMSASGEGMNVGASDTAEEREADQVAEVVTQRSIQRHGDGDHVDE